MNTENPIHKIPAHYHLIAEVALFIIIALLLLKFLFFKPDIILDKQGVVKNSVLNFSLLPDGTFIVAKPNGEVIDTVQMATPDNKGGLKQLHSIGIAVTEDDNNKKMEQKASLLDWLVSPATATAVNEPGHRYWNYNYVMSNVSNCVRFDITNYPPSYWYVGACF